MKKIIYMLMSMVCISCIEPFKLEYDDDPIIFLEAFPGVEDVVVFNIRPAYSYSSTAVRPELRPEITFMVNGRVVPVEHNDGTRFGDRYAESCYIADYKPVPGDKLSVEVSSPGFSTIYAVTEIPQPFPERKIGYRNVASGEFSSNMVSVSFADAGDTDCAYGLQILEESLVYKPDGSFVESLSRYAGYSLSYQYTYSPEPLSGMNVPFNGWQLQPYSYGDGYMAVWDDDIFNGKETSLSMSVQGFSYESFFENETVREMNVEGTNGRYRVLNHNKLLLYSLSDEFYRYAVAQNLIGENATIEFGLAPSNFCYSNVRNGYGVFAGIWCVETDWITKESIENE